MSQEKVSKGFQKSIERIKNGRLIKSVEKTLRSQGRTTNDKLNSVLMNKVVTTEEKELKQYKITRTNVRENSSKLKGSGISIYITFKFPLGNTFFLG